MSKYVRDKAHCKHDAYTKEEMDNLINDNVYTKEETNSLLEEINTSLTNTNDNVASINDKVSSMATETNVSVTGLPGRSTYKCVCVQSVGICYFQATITGVNLSEDTTLDLGKVNSAYAPKGYTPLAVFRGSPYKIECAINEAGNIRFRSEVNISSSETLYISGCWVI